MKYEKSCGAVIYRLKNNIIEYLLVMNKKGKGMGHWGFPKGHVENNETEVDTAKREIFEETGIVADIDTGFRMISNYSPRQGVNKDAVYFVSRAEDCEIKLQESEICDFLWCSFEKAQSILVHDKHILSGADEYLKEKYSDIL